MSRRRTGRSHKLWCVSDCNDRVKADAASARAAADAAALAGGDRAAWRTDHLGPLVAGRRATPRTAGSPRLAGTGFLAELLILQLKPLGVAPRALKAWPAAPAHNSPSLRWWRNQAQVDPVAGQGVEQAGGDTRPSHDFCPEMLSFGSPAWLVRAV